MAECLPDRRRVLVLTFYFLTNTRSFNQNPSDLIEKDGWIAKLRVRKYVLADFLSVLFLSCVCPPRPPAYFVIDVRPQSPTYRGQPLNNENLFRIDAIR